MRAKILSINDLTENQINSMFRLMNEYYEHVTCENFRNDLFEKQKVILLVERDESIRGFSTIIQTTMNSAGKSFIAIYSGDTVLEKKYWGNGILAMAFGRYLIEVKLKNPMTSVYWFLISKGYKTYLLMTNNFSVHYPRFEKGTPRSYQTVMEEFYGQRFGKLYDSKRNLIRFDQDKISYLKISVADITEELRRNPRIAFFEKANPDWKEGAELACVAKVTMWIPLRYVFKRFFKLFKATKPSRRFEALSESLPSQPQSM